MRATRTYRALDPDKVIETIGLAAPPHRRALSRRRPRRACAPSCCCSPGENSARAEKIAGRNIPLRVAIFVLLAAGVAALAWIVRLFTSFPTAVDNVFNVLQGVEAAANLIVLMGAGVFFLTRIEERLKRRARAAGAARAALDRARHRHAPAHQGPERGGERRRQHALLAARAR